MKATCTYCKKKFEMRSGNYNRSMSQGLPVFCSRGHFGLHRRLNKTKEQKKAEKAAYDKQYRQKNQQKIAERKKEYHQANYDPEKQRKYNKKRYKEHLKYLQRPEYKQYKKGYDQTYRAKKFYGKYWEAFIALRNLQGIVDNRQAKQDQKSINKSQKRKHHAKKLTKRKELESCTMGIYQPG